MARKEKQKEAVRSISLFLLFFYMKIAVNQILYIYYLFYM